MKLFVGARENGQQVRPLSWMHLTQVQPIIAYGRSALPGMMPEYGPHSHSPLGLCPKNKQKKVWDWRNNMGYTCLTHGTPSSLPNIKLTKKLNFFVAAILKGLCALSLICDTRDTTGVSSCLYGKCLNPFYLSAQKTEAGFICLFACLFGEGCVLAHIWWYWGGGGGNGGHSWQCSWKACFPGLWSKKLKFYKARIQKGNTKVNAADWINLPELKHKLRWQPQERNNFELVCQPTSDTSSINRPWVIMATQIASSGRYYH